MSTPSSRDTLVAEEHAEFLGEVGARRRQVLDALDQNQWPRAAKPATSG